MPLGLILALSFSPINISRPGLFFHLISGVKYPQLSAAGKKARGKALSLAGSVENIHHFFPDQELNYTLATHNI